MNPPFEYWQVGVAFDQAIEDIMHPNRLRDHLKVGLRHNMGLQDHEPIPKEIELPEADFPDRLRHFEVDLDKDPILLLETQYKSNKILGPRFTLIVAVGVIEEDEDFGYKMDKFLVRMRYNAILSDMLTGPCDCEFFYSQLNLKDEVKS